MAKITKLFMNGNSQAVCLPRELRFPGDRVRIRPVHGGVLLEPVEWNVREWLARLDRSRPSEPFMKKGRNQPIAPKGRIFD
jgi:virulence-associated protein VagC